MKRTIIWMAALWVCLAWAHQAKAQESSPSGQEFFAKEIQPIFVERCYGCHSAQAGKLKGGLSLDTRVGLLKGGDGGPVIVPGHPEKSRLVEAIQYGNVDLQMPPKGKLSDREINALTAWIKKGASWPEGGSSAALSTESAFDLEKRRQSHWAWQPICRTLPPSAQKTEWSRGAIDQFILARLEQGGLQPAPEAEKRVLLRRLSFDLTGLPPTAGEVAEFVKDGCSDAYERAVDRLLGSPHFGERWARHWLDLVRYAETLGHEFDYGNPNAWRYRDYVVRAFNQDVPYDQFTREHVAGDLCDPPRQNAVEHFNESVIGTAFYWLGQRDHSPVDVKQHQAELVDNQIDVLSKTFLGLTVACARCHDHKFDAISSQDYYSLYGILSSSRYTQAALLSPGATTSAIQELTDLKLLLRHAVGREWSRQAKEMSRYVAAVKEWQRGWPSELTEEGERLEAFCEERNLHAGRLAAWLEALATGRARAELAEKLQLAGGQNDEDSLKGVPRGVEATWADFTRLEQLPSGWFVEGDAFTCRTSKLGDFEIGTRSRPISRMQLDSTMDSGVISRRLQGVLRSPTFTITNRYVHILAAGRNVRINIPVDNFTMIRDPIYGGLKRVLSQDDFGWTTVDLDMWRGHLAYLEFNDTSVPDPADDPRPTGFGSSGFLAIRKIVFSEKAQPPQTESDTTDALNAAEPLEAFREFERDEAVIRGAVEAWTQGANLSRGQAGLLDWLLRHELLDVEDNSEVGDLVVRFRQTENMIPDPARVPAMTDGTGRDESVFIRGSHKMPGARAQRQFLQAIAGGRQPEITAGSGRRELAAHLTAPANPLLARVMVNRIWLHLFGRGLVETPDDFGVLGQRPSHPELLDWLADWFRTEGGWSVKRLIRLLVCSSTYRMSSFPGDAFAEERDPDNRLWHRMPVRRLEGEVIRDAILAVSGTLDERVAGPPVPTHLTEFMDGRGRPGTSGPLDGAGRRTLYLEVRRNFLDPMMRAFDLPVPFTTVGRRTVSNVPAQSLFLLNDPFVIQEAGRWSTRMLARADSSPAERIHTLYQDAFGRDPARSELDRAFHFLERQCALYQESGNADGAQRQSWADLCQVLVNSKEFVFLE